MKIFSWNVNGIRSRIFNDLISSKLKKNQILEPTEGSPIAELLKYDPDFICLQETRCSVNLGNEIKIQGYNSIFNESKLDGARSSCRYSGTCIFYKQGIKINKVEYHIPGYPDEEGRIIIIYTDNLTVINVYAPNSGTNFENKKIFMDCMLNFLDSISGTVIFCGDINIAIDTHFDKTKVEPSAGFFPHELKFHEDLKSIGYNDILSDSDKTIYTWWDPRQRKENGMSIARNRNKGWRLDYFFVKNNTFGLHSRVLKYIGENNEGIPLASDHGAILAEIKI
jgi:exodeoxyribonuclease III